MAFTVADLTRIESAIIALATGTRKVRMTMNDKTVEYAPADLDKLRLLKNEIASSLTSSVSRPRALVAQTSKGL